MQKILLISLISIISISGNETILPTKDWFVEKLFSNYANDTSDSDRLHVKDLEKIMSELHLVNFNTSSSNHSSRTKKCYLPNELLIIFNITGDTINKKDFSELSKSLVFMSLEKECSIITSNHQKLNSNKCNLKSDKYLFGSISIFVIWIATFASIFIVTKLEKFRDYINIGLSGLGTATLLGDALLHIIPSALNLHVHSDHEEGTLHTDKSKREATWKMCFTIGSIFVLWTIEILVGKTHDHSHDKPKQIVKIETEVIQLENISSSKDLKAIDTKIQFFEGYSKLKFKSYIKNIESTGWTALIGNLMHKITDGLAIGAAFEASLSVGISTCLAILFHEIPHELGDFAVYKNSGFNNMSIFMVNCLSSACSLIAFYTILLVSPSASLRGWIFSITAGIFFYISLSFMIPKIKSLLEENKSKKNAVIALASFVLGWGVMLLLALFEDDIKVNLNC